MEKNEFYLELKEKAGFIANILGIASILITLFFFIYSKTIASDDLLASFRYYELPFDYKKIEKYINNPQLEMITKDTIPLTDIQWTTAIELINKSDNRIKSIEIPLEGFHSDHTTINKGYIMHNGKMEYFKDKKHFTVSNVIPNQPHKILIFANTTGIHNNSFLIADDKSYAMRQVIEITTENDFDNWMTSSVIGSKTLQTIIYLLSISGLYYFVRIVIPFIISLVPNRKTNKTTGNNA